jgi:hypothetical protein
VNQNAAKRGNGNLGGSKQELKRGNLGKWELRRVKGELKCGNSGKWKLKEGKAAI